MNFTCNKQFGQKIKQCFLWGDAPLNSKGMEKT